MCPRHPRRGWRQCALCTMRSVVTRVSVTTIYDYFVLTGCSKTRTAGAQSILKTCIPVRTRTTVKLMCCERGFNPAFGVHSSRPVTLRYQRWVWFMQVVPCHAKQLPPAGIQGNWRHRVYCHDTFAILWVLHDTMHGVKWRRFIVLFK